MITMIWCEDANHGIGIDNKMPWNIKEEMAHFRLTTKNKIVVMGRKTLESIGGVLPYRTNIVLTRDLNYKSFEGAIVFHDIAKLIHDYNTEDIFVIGGKSIYEQFLPYADQLIISRLNQEYSCNCFMDLVLDDFVETNQIKKDEFTIHYYDRKQ